MTAPSNPPLIICFGDSLTAGFQSPTLENRGVAETPYGRFLQEALGSHATVAVSGICGETTGEMVMRFRADVLAHHPASVVILGGTNDLGWNARPAEIMRNLLKMYEQARALGIEPVAVTVPSLRAGQSPDGGAAEPVIQEHIARRLELNTLITDYCLSKTIACVDLFTDTAEAGTRLLALQYSNDGLHLTTAGYRRLAALLFDEVFAPRLGVTAEGGPGAG